MVRARRWLALGIVPSWVVLAGVTFMWPSELEKVIERVESGPHAATFQDIQILKKGGTDEAVALLFELLARNDHITNLNAARAIAELEREKWMPPVAGDGGRLEETLVDWLDQPDADMRRAGCDLLGLIGATGQRDRVAMMVTDADLDVRASCVRSLLGLYVGADDLDPVKNMAVQILSDPYHEVRVHAITGLGTLGVKETFVSFLPLLESDNPSMRSKSLQAVTNIDPEQAYPFAVKALGDADHEVRVAGVMALGAIGDPAAVEELEPVLDDVVLGRYAVETLGRIEDRRAFEKLLEVLEVPPLRDAALHAISGHKAPGVDAVAQAMLTSWDADELRMLVRVGFFHPSPEYIPGLERILGMAPERRYDVLEVLWGIHDRKAMHMALSMVSDTTPKIQRMAIMVAGGLLEHVGPDPLAHEVISDALCYEDHDVRMEALRFVRIHEIGIAAPLLVPLLESRFDDESLAAAAALVELGEPIGVPIVVAALASPSKEVRREAATVLSRERPAAALAPLLELVSEDLGNDRWHDGAGTRLDLLGQLMHEQPSKQAVALVREMLVHEDVEVRALGARAAARSALPELLPVVAKMMGGKIPRLRRVLAPRLHHLGTEGIGMLDAALSDPDAMTRALAVLSLGLTEVLSGEEKRTRYLAALVDPDEFVRINAAAGLRELGPGVDVDVLCKAYERDLTAMETLSALMILAEHGAPCLQPHVERLLLHPSSASMGGAIEAVRIGIGTGAVQLTDKVRLGLGTCAQGHYYLFSDTCEAVLEGRKPSGDSCPTWTPLAATAKTTGVEPWEGSPAYAEVLPGVYHVRASTALTDGHPVFVADGALTLRVSVIEDDLAAALPPPRCGEYSAGGVLRF